MWIYDKDKKKFRELQDDDPHIESSPNASPGMVRYYPRLQKTRRVKIFGNQCNVPKWTYVYAGKTKEECLANTNRYVLSEIAELKEKIGDLESQLVKG